MAVELGADNSDTIESLNMTFRKVIKNRAMFPSDEAVFKTMYLALKNISKGLPEPRSWRSRRKAKIREYDKDNFNGGNMDDIKDSVATECNHSHQPEQPEQPSMYEVEPNVEDLPATDKVVGGQNNVTSNEKNENLHSVSAVTPKRGKQVRKLKEKDNINQPSLFDLIPGTQNTLFRV